MKTTVAHFKQFQKFCRTWQQRFGLTSYKLYFRHEKLDGKYGSTGYRINARTAGVTLATEWNDERSLNSRELNRLAKHELLHLLLGELFVLAEDRYASADSLDRDSGFLGIGNDVFRRDYNCVFRRVHASTVRLHRVLLKDSLLPWCNDQSSDT